MEREVKRAVVCGACGGPLADADAARCQYCGAAMAQSREAAPGVAPPASAPSGPDMRGQQLKQINMAGQDLSGAVLSGATLKQCNLSGVNLRGANLSSAILKQTNLSGSDLRGVDWTGAILKQCNLSGAKLDPGAPMSSAAAVKQCVMAGAGS